jgi:hypothetical protein
MDWKCKVVECLLCKRKALSSNHSPKKLLSTVGNINTRYICHQKGCSLVGETSQKAELDLGKGVESLKVAWGT